LQGDYLKDALEDVMVASAEELSVPGASVAIYRGDELVEAATGVTNLASGDRVRTTTPFLIGSITKVWTATLIMLLVDDGGVELDAPVHQYVPEFRLPDPNVTEAVTLRHLLTHTSGIDEDLTLAEERGDECLRLYVERLTQLPMLHSPGQNLSYCNSGFITAGRLVECVTGGVFDEVLRERIFKPLELHQTATFPEEAVLRSPAIGHIESDSGLFPTPIWSLPRSTGPAGGTLCTTAGDLVRFARMHLTGGVGPHGRRVMSSESIAAMQSPQMPLPDLTHGTHIGLGWFLGNVGASASFGHFGGNIGQLCGLTVVPEYQLAIAILTNGFSTTAFHTRILDFVSDELRPVGNPPVMSSRASAPRPARAYTGEFGSHSGSVSITYDESADALQLNSSPRDNWVNRIYAMEKPAGNLTILDDHTCEIATPSLYGELRPRVHFSFDDHGVLEFIHIGVHLYPRLLTDAPTSQVSDTETSAFSRTWINTNR
jgi:CubicO group peptidase (beta-lactamase class C family)